MIYETSYDSGRLPYKPDLTRGYWAKPSDFILTGMSLAFRLDIFSITWVIFAYEGCASVVPYIICLFLFVVPLFIIQSFIGQFSSSGFISVFRMTPIFKGIGYISLAVNLGVLTYYSIFAAIPLFYLFHSLRPTLPWSCEGIKNWLHTFNGQEVRHLCHMLHNETAPEFSQDDWFIVTHELPSNLFLKSHFDDIEVFEPRSRGFYISWEVLLCTLLVWTIIAAVFYKWHTIEKLGTLLRYSILTTCLLLFIVVVRFSLVPKDPWLCIYNFFVPKVYTFLRGFPTVSLYIVSAFGVGWGTIIALASYNKFKTNIIQNSWTICLGQMFMFFSFAFLIFVTDSYFEEIKDAYNDDSMEAYAYITHTWALFLSTGSVMAEMAWPNLWCILYYTMLLLAALITMTTSLKATLQSLFDEFEVLRARKTEVMFIVISLLAMSSLYTCTSQGVFFHIILSNDTLVTQTALNLLLILVILWIYGRVRFQRDIEFMLGQSFATWKIYMLRFVAPLCLIVLLIGALALAFAHHEFGSLVLQIAALLFIVLPWLYVPGYMLYIMLQTTGTFKTRFARCCRPLDWYPVELEDRQRYEESMRNADASHQLSQLDDETAT
ncbi:sodium- and chloride-dependent neutral and basic amino acid transporter B(0+)-like [Anastrepha obliqua]|uniref:sodium- and chloride-dependent neutral and basic amino acid transporter B(0+)-like n=1 Tax=Anastrepha obliqua TaxID=95512 RepID=UPI00240924ED|nr:sodium- and chloride-dependent neutral and basic amino acid transporter B(0+)-like [Anastrepha obliqua]